MSARSFDITKTTKQSNIRVRNDNGITTVELHGHPIFSYIRSNRVIQLSSCGWKTVTTKTAINRAFSQLNFPFSVFQKRGEWFLYNRETNTEVDFNDEMTVNLGV